MSNRLRVTIWNEYRHEKLNPVVGRIYPNGIHEALAEPLRAASKFELRTATLDEPSHGLTPEVLENTDVLLWWGHMAHDEVEDDIVTQVQERVLAGMGLIALHSAHHSKIFKKLMGTSCSLRWRENNEVERLWVVKPSHPIANGLDPYFELQETEMYGEHFDIPAPDDLVLVSWFAGGEIFRSGCCFHRGHGKIFYFRPGHETLPIYCDKNVQRVISNGIDWAAPSSGPSFQYGNGAAIHAVASPTKIDN